MIQPAPFPETILGERVFRGLVPESVSQAAYAEYLRHFQHPATLHARCEDYRAAASVDLEHDESDLDEKIRCPVFTLWGGDGAMESLWDVVTAGRNEQPMFDDSSDRC